MIPKLPSRYKQSNYPKDILKGIVKKELKRMAKMKEKQESKAEIITIKQEKKAFNEMCNRYKDAIIYDDAKLFIQL
jgi:hypothetical protein